LEKDRTLLRRMLGCLAAALGGLYVAQALG
jgi:hypothetical protein